MSPERRDMTPALGKRGEPGPWRPERDGAGVELAQPEFGDAQWSYLYGRGDTRYAPETPEPEEIARANRRMRSMPIPEPRGPFIKAPVWTWEVPLYFWVGGVASGASFVALACDAAGDRRSAALVRKVALGVVAPAPVLLIADLGRPARFLNMLRIFKPRSPMNMGAWCLVGFSATAAGGVGADLLGRRRTATGLGLATALLGGYLGSYTGVLLASTAVPLWARSRLFLGPIFVSTATATGAAASRLALSAAGLHPNHATSRALRWLAGTAISCELALSAINERRLGALSSPLRRGRPGWMYRAAQTSVLLGLAAQLAARSGARRAEDAASVLYLGGGLAYRYAWVYAGRDSAADPTAAAAMGRGGNDLAQAGDSRAASATRRPATVPGGRLWGEVVRRVSLAVERRLAG